MIRRGLILDTNILFLYVLGLLWPEAIRHHKRTSGYRRSDFEKLLGLVGDNRLILVPHVVAEVANLMDAGRDWRSDQMHGLLVHLLDRFGEVVIPSVEAGSRREFARLGVTDTILLCLGNADCPMVTADRPLFVAAAAAGHPVIYFKDWLSAA